MLMYVKKEEEILKNEWRKQKAESSSVLLFN